MDTNPPCSTWSVWTGKEIEGTVNLGMATLFIRKLPQGYTLNSMLQEASIKQLIPSRVWFCKEFLETTDSHLVILDATACFETVCVEMDDRHTLLPSYVRERVKIYYKLPINLKRGDHVCVGRAFEDEAFVIGQGARVTKQEYLDDVCLYP